MVQFDQRTHDLLMRGGFRYCKKSDRYFQHTEAKWDVEKRIEKGKKQYAVPCSSVGEFKEGEAKMVETLVTRLRDKARKAGKEVPVDGESDVEEEAPKKKKRKQSADAVEEEEEPVKKKKKKQVVEEEEEE
eukprot:TRINITY_DN84094_c0_g1_i1.p2 TRINITY_DN84094_c0_g1~~TRINITY_DN84094_c0_g1_i1.p2  ORF type:complete len:131 (-),score=69.02 TRINITY_DN84094_c0_g1_i1:65-457(-)